MSSAVGMILPPVGPDGRRQTPNRGLSPQETLWHVRMALNVAALGCDRYGDGARTGYNSFLSQHRKTLDAAYRSVDAQYKARFGKAGEDQRDDRNTKVYNFFALPPAQHGFCAAAAKVAGEAGGMRSDQLTAFAPRALDRLEQPFLDFYAAYAAYQDDLAAWHVQSRMASVAPAPSRGAGRSVTATIPDAKPLRMAEAAPKKKRAPKVKAVEVAAVKPAPVSVPAPARAVETEPVRTASVATGGFVIQVGAFDSPDAARSAWTSLRDAQPSIGTHPAVNSRATVNGKLFHRLGIGGFASKGDAATLCSQLKAKGTSCFVRASQPGDNAVRWASR